MAVPTLVEPIERGPGIFVLEFGDTYFEVHSALGGRVIQYARAAVPMLVTRDQVAGDAANNFGSTFWTSPQSTWNWPPPTAIDSEPYTGVVNAVEGSITLTGPVAVVGDARIRLTKTFRADLANDAIVCEFRLQNVGSTLAKMAHWQITRVPAGGLTFFPTGSSAVATGLDVVHSADGVSWFDWETAAPAADGKYIADGAEGWLAHVGGGLIFVKKFVDISLAQAAPGEGEVEIYATASHRYVEIEPQGPLESIVPGGSTAWSVVWKLRALPSEIQQGVGALGLVELARSIAQSR